jgi:hypothetical protein
MADGPDEMPTPALTRQAIRTPRAAAIAGIAFSVLLTAAFVLMRLAVPRDPEDAGTWLTDGGKRDLVIVALNLLPFAGIAFLWFIGVVRDRIGDSEDRFFATVFLGSGLLFIAMLFATGAVAGGLVLTASERPAAGVWSFGRRTIYTLFTVYAMRMAAVFTISTTTIATRLKLAPRWLTVLGFATGAILLTTAGTVPWIELVFPTWVLVFSVHILVVSFRTSQPDHSNTGAD